MIILNRRKRLKAARLLMTKQVECNRRDGKCSSGICRVLSMPDGLHSKDHGAYKYVKKRLDFIMRSNSFYYRNNDSQQLLKDDNFDGFHDIRLDCIDKIFKGRFKTT